MNEKKIEIKITHFIATAIALDQLKCNNYKRNHVCNYTPIRLRLRWINSLWLWNNVIPKLGVTVKYKKDYFYSHQKT